MTVHVGPYEFDHVSYDEEGDVLYLRRGEPRAAADAFGTPEGHAVRLDENHEIIGITLVNPRWLAEHEGKVVVTLPNPIETDAADLAQVLAGG